MSYRVISTGSLEARKQTRMAFTSRDLFRLNGKIQERELQSTVSFHLEAHKIGWEKKS